MDQIPAESIHSVDGKKYLFAFGADGCLEKLQGDGIGEWSDARIGGSLEGAEFEEAHVVVSFTHEVYVNQRRHSFRDVHRVCRRTVWVYEITRVRTVNRILHVAIASGSVVRELKNKSVLYHVNAYIEHNLFVKIHSFYS